MELRMRSRLPRCLARVSMLALFSFLLGGFVASADAQTVLNGTVSDRTTGVAVAGAMVSPPCGQSTLTDANGRYAFTTEQVCNSPTGYISVQAATYFSVVQVPFTITAAPTTFDITLLPGVGPVLQGTVTDAATHAGVADVSVQICSPTYSFVSYGVPTSCASSFTTAGGQYLIDSSQVQETSAAGFDIFYVFAAHSGYFNYQESNG